MDLEHIENSLPWRCKLAPPALASLLCGAAYVFFLMVVDRSPPFRYDGGWISCPSGEQRCVTVPDTSPAVVEAQEGAEVTRHRLVSWFRDDCEIQITGQLSDVHGNVKNVDAFDVHVDQSEMLKKFRATGKPLAFSRNLRAEMPADAEGIKTYGQICYISRDFARCNWLQRWHGLWGAFRHFPIEVNGPMMCFREIPPVSAVGHQ